MSQGGGDQEYGYGYGYGMHDGDGGCDCSCDQACVEAGENCVTHVFDENIGVECAITDGNGNYQGFPCCGHGGGGNDGPPDYKDLEMMALRDCSKCGRGFMELMEHGGFNDGGHDDGGGGGGPPECIRACIEDVTGDTPEVRTPQACLCDLDACDDETKQEIIQNGPMPPYCCNRDLFTADEVDDAYTEEACQGVELQSFGGDGGDGDRRALLAGKTKQGDVWSRKGEGRRLDGHGGDHGDEGHGGGHGGGPDCALAEKFIEECDEKEFDEIGFGTCDMPHDGDGGDWPPPCFSDQWEEDGCNGGDYCACDLSTCEYHGQDQYEFCRNCGNPESADFCSCEDGDDFCDAVQDAIDEAGGGRRASDEDARRLDGPPACVESCDGDVCEDGGIKPSCATAYDTCPDDDKKTIEDICMSQGGGDQGHGGGHGGGPDCGLLEKFIEECE